MDLKNIIQEEWEKVRKGFYYPQLPQPKLVNNIPNAYINMKNLSINVSEPFITDFKEHGVEEADALNEVLTHELTHFMKYPGSVLNILKLHKTAREIVEGNKASVLRDAFTEAQTNIYMVKELKHPSTVKMRTIVKPDKNDSLGRLMYGLYQKVWEQNLGVKLRRKEKKLIKKLKDIDYLDKETEMDSFKSFVQILKDYKLEERENYGPGPSMFSDNEIKEGIRQFAQECDNPAEFEEIVKELLSKGTKAGTDKGITLLAGNFYTALAEKYQIPIRKKPLHKNGSLYPHSHTSFSVSDPLTDLDPFSTPGILPGITKKWVRKEGEVATNFEAVPNSALVVDNSPSMFSIGLGEGVVSPSEMVYQHIVGATAISNAYLDNDSKVAVYSFGSNDYFNDFSKDKEEIHKALRRYSTKGGTRFNPKFLENVLKESEEEFDISVVSDMAISNLDTFINAVLNIPKIHRVHLIYTDDNGHVKKLKAQFGNQENVGIVPLLQENDIEEIIMGELKKSVR